MSVKNLKYYLDHPDEMPEDPKEIEKLANETMAQALESGQEQVSVDRFVEPEDKKDDKPGVSSDAKVEAAVVTEEPKVEPPVEADDKPDGILAKDGKNVIPYSQLETARARATAAENLAKEQAQRIAQLETEKTAPQGDDVTMLTDAELEVLEADSPTLAKTLRAQQTRIEKLTEQVEKVTQRQETQAATEEAEIKSEVQTAIDENPTLAAWQTAEDQSMWQEASRLDRTLRKSPKYANVSFADRFKKVVELTEAVLEVKAEAPVVQQPALTPDQIKAAAKVKLDAANKAKKPLSLSDIPGGAAPAVDERQKVEEMSPTALGNQFMGMTRDQIDAYVANL